jgi:outer membrane protein TolC
VVMARAALNELTGDALDAAPPLTTSLQPPNAGAASAPPQRPEQERARLDSELARQRTVLAKLAWLPQVNLRGAFEADRQRFVTRAGANWMGAVSLRWNLFDGGAQRASVRGAVEAERAATSQAAAVDARVKREVFQAQAQLDATRARVAVAEKSVAAAAESLRITRDRYGAGLATVTDLLRTETAALETKLQVLAAQHGVRAALLNLAVAQGQLSPEAEILQ